MTLYDCIFIICKGLTVGTYDRKLVVRHNQSRCLYNVVVCGYELSWSITSPNLEKSLFSVVHTSHAVKILKLRPSASRSQCRRESTESKHFKCKSDLLDILKLSIDN